MLNYMIVLLNLRKIHDEAKEYLITNNLMKKWLQIKTYVLTKYLVSKNGVAIENEIWNNLKNWKISHNNTVFSPIVTINCPQYSLTIPPLSVYFTLFPLTHAKTPLFPTIPHFTSLYYKLLIYK